MPLRSYYEDALVTLYHGDCREILPRIACDFIVTDPPYGVTDHEWDDVVLLWNADCRDVLPQIDKVDAVITDPPYGISFAAQPT